MTLHEALSAVTDPRRAEGLRIDLGQMFCMVVVANLCGHFGGRPVARFAKAHAATFTDELGLRHNVPSHVTFTDLLNRVDGDELVPAFNRWAATVAPLGPGTAVSGDGKALGSTVTSRADGTGQDFQAVVSMFCHDSGLVHSIGEYRNAKESEIGIVRFLVGRLEGMGAVLYLDALHAQKKR